MLRSLKEMEHYAVSATDGDCGTVANFLFDDERWVVRHLVVNAGSFLNWRGPVLISPISFGRVDWSSRHFHLALTRDKIKHSPSVDVDKPVSRQLEWDYYGYYGYPYYWGYAGSWGMGGYPGLFARDYRNAAPSSDAQPSGDVHLRSAREVRGYHVQGKDEEIGHVDDFIVDDETWQIRYLVIDTKNWWFGKKVLVSPLWAGRVSWSERMVYVDMTRQAIKDSPEWDAEVGINREYEARLYDYYGRPIYWDSAARPSASSPSSRSAVHAR